MTRICSYCKKGMGYKCHVCNEPLRQIGINLVGMWGHCSECCDYRRLDAGGTTHGICDDCTEKAQEKGR